MSKRTSELLIEDILDSCNKIMTYTKGLSFVDFVSDQKTIDAVIPSDRGNIFKVC